MDGVLNDWYLEPSLQGRHTPLNTRRPEKRSPGTILLRSGSALSISCFVWSDALILGIPEEESAVVRFRHVELDGIMCKRMDDAQLAETVD